ncbi:hypothetical protein M9Y10_022535 [Tritrichomonas musculus]|uniref:E2F/DP family winged-helix DNA-binding domain-containing protein n=1 Tax=Tritrichomonas musculus TaxID=1915356 RepID=A0ABR2KSS2_9EUKA
MTNYCGLRMQPFPAFQVTYQPPQVKQTDDLKISIQMLINELESSINQVQEITLLTQRYNIKRRRLYDVINVFSSVGSCSKSGLDHLIWYGKDQLCVHLEKLKQSYHIKDPNYTLLQLFPVSGCIGISNLTICFLLLFFALKTNRLDLRYVGNLFSRQTSRYKTTLCKLYQISYILGAVGITNRTNQVCEVVLNEPYYNEEIVPDEPTKDSDNFQNQGKDKKSLIEDNPMSIFSLLNHTEKTEPKKPNPYQYILDRRKEFHNLS